MSAQASVPEALSGRRVLVIVDNCEHVLDAAGELIELIERRAPTVTVLATSREGLGVAGEQQWPVGSLDTGAGSAAVRLFVDRARDAVPGFDPSLEESAIVEVCERLDGIALAIELAAARMRSMSASQVRDRLNVLKAGFRMNADVAVGWLTILFNRLGDSRTAATIYGLASLQNIPFINGIDDTLNQLRDTLGGEQFDSCVHAGRTLDRHQAITYTQQHVALTLEQLADNS